MNYDNKSTIYLFKESASLMMSHKSQLFLFWLWYPWLLCLLTQGIHYLWLTPQFSTTLDLFHKEISTVNIQE
jgi:uncharacterized membrane protein